MTSKKFFSPSKFYAYFFNLNFTYKILDLILLQTIKSISFFLKIQIFKTAIIILTVIRLS